MSINITTNIDELISIIDKDIKGMLKSAELSKAGKQAGLAIGRHVGDSLLGNNKSGYDYRQSGGLESLVAEEGRNPELRQRQNDMTIGVFELNNMNNANVAKRNHQFQTHEVWDYKTHEMVRENISLKAETQMPKWILAEFGSGEYADGDYEQFNIAYTRRDKPFLYGPSYGAVGGEGGGPKKGYFMVTGQTLRQLKGPIQENSLNDAIVHSGIRAGHVFSIGLDSAKEEVYEILGEGIEEYLARIQKGG